MNTLFALIAGALVGTLYARRREGVLLDYIHFAVVFALIFAIVGIIFTLILSRATG